MNKILVLIILSIFTIPLFSQSDSTKIPFIAYWEKGDSYDFKVTKVNKRWTNDKLTINDSTQYVANFKVIDSTEKSYTIQWSFKDNLINTYKDNLNKIYEDQQAVNNIIKKYDVTKIIYETNEYGEFLEIVNWKDVSTLMSKMLGELESSIQIRNPDKLNEVKQAMQPIVEIYSSKEGIEQLIINELLYFHFPFGTEYDINTPLEYEQELPNLLGGGPIKADARLSILETDLEDFYCVLKEEVIINSEDAIKQVILLFDKMGIDDSNNEEIMKTAVFDISDLNYYQYYYDPGVPHRIFGSRKILLNMDNNEVKHIETLEVELVYEE